MQLTKQEKQTKFCTFAKLKLKETKEDFHVSGFVATSHPDRAVSEDGKFAGDIIPKGTLQKIVNDINNKYKPQAGAVSERHDHLKAEDLDLPVAGVLAPDSIATLRQLEDGEWGAHVDTILSKTNPRYEEVKTNIEQGVYPGFSIEYDNTEFTPTEKEGKMYRLLTNLDTEGFGYAHRRKIANPHAEYTDFGFKEISAISTIQEINKKGETKMTEKKDVPKEEPKEEPKEPEEKKEQPKEPAEEKPVEPSGKEYTVSAEDIALLKEFKEKKEKEARVKEITESKEFKEAHKANIKEIMTKGAPRFNTDGEGKPEFKELEKFVKPETKMKEFDEAHGKHMEWKIREKYKEKMEKGSDDYLK